MCNVLKLKGVNVCEKKHIREKIPEVLIILQIKEDLLWHIPKSESKTLAKTTLFFALSFFYLR